MVDGNPMLQGLSSKSGTNPMTVSGTAQKSLLLLALVLVGAMYSYTPTFSPLIALGSALVAFVVALVTIRNPSISMYTSPVYALLEGVALGYVSVLADMKYPGVAMEAVLGTVGVFGVMAFLYTQNIITVNSKYIKIVFSCMVGILVIYVADLIMSLFGVRVPIVTESSPWGIGFSIFVVIIAALNIAIDFESIKENVEQKASKEMEWFCAFGLMVSLIWLYLEILRLLQKIKK